MSRSPVPLTACSTAAWHAIRNQRLRRGVDCAWRVSAIATLRESVRCDRLYGCNRRSAVAPKRTSTSVARKVQSEPLMGRPVFLTATPDCTGRPDSPRGFPEGFRCPLFVPRVQNVRNCYLIHVLFSLRFALKIFGFRRPIVLRSSRKGVNKLKSQKLSRC